MNPRVRLRHVTGFRDRSLPAPPTLQTWRKEEELNLREPSNSTLPQRPRQANVKKVITLTVEAIKEAINKLPEEDKVSLTSWLNVQTMDDWDRQMQRDFSPGGKGAKFLEQAKRETAEGLAQGTVRPLSEGLAERRRRS